VRRSGRLPASPPTRSPSASTANEPDDQQQYQRTEGGTTTDEGAYDSNEEITDDPKPGALLAHI